MGLLFVGLMGFGATGLSGTIRNVGMVGEKPISVQTYSNQLNQEISALQQQFGRAVTFQEATAFGVPQRVQQQLVATIGVDNEAANIGLSVGDEQVREQVLQIPQFRGLNGSFDRDAYRSALAQNGQSESEFETSIRDDAARSLLQLAVAGGVQTNDAYAEALLTYIGARRDFVWGFVTEDDVSIELPEPTDEALKAYYDDTPAQFTLPEAKKLTYVSLTPDMILDTVDVDDASIDELYAERKSDFSTPERRLVERLVFGDEAQAQAAFDRINAGEATFDTLVEERGLNLSDVDLGDVTREDLGDAADTVFFVESNTTVGPLPSDLGPALFRINAILAERNTPEEDAKSVLREELAQDRARRVIEDLSIQFDELLAGGATLEELAAESELELGTIEWTQQSDDGIAAYSDFRNAATDVSLDDFPEIDQLDDGGIFALRLDETLEERLQPYEDVIDAVLAGWTAAETQKALLEQAKEIAVKMSYVENPADLDVVLTTETNITRRDFIQGTSPEFIPNLFDMEIGATNAFDLGDAIVVARMDAAHPPAEDAEETDLIRQSVAQQANTGVAQDLLEIYSAAIQLNTDVSINQQAINAVHANFGGHGGQ